MTVPTETACAEAEDGGRISTNAQDYLFTEPPGAALEDDDSRGIEDDDEELSGCEEGYLEIGRLLVGHLELQKGKTVTELDLTFWYLEQVEKEIGDEHQLFAQQRLVRQVVDWLIKDVGRIVVVQPPRDPRRPEDRVLKARTREV